MWPIPLSAPDCHRSVSTGRPESACSVSGVMKRQAAAVMQTSTTMSALTKSRVEFGSLVRGDAAGQAEHDPRKRLEIPSSQWRMRDATARSLHWPRDFAPVAARARLRGIGDGATNRAAHACQSTAPRSDERPRERLLRRGAAALSDAELVALLLRTGTARQSALEVARSLIARFDGLSGLLAAPVAEVVAVHGVGPAKGAELAAIVELARRVVGAAGAPARCAGLAAGGTRLPAAVARGAPVRGLRGPVSRQPEPAAGRRRALSRHARADVRLPARGRQGGARAQRRRR